MDAEKQRGRGEGVGRLVRFGAVGVANTAVDFAVTNLLATALGLGSSGALVLASAAGCAAATLNSYFLNRRWTFGDTGREGTSSSMGKFFLVAGVSLVVNTSVFLFFAKYLPTRYGVSPLLALNAAKAAGVASAMAVSFLGYRFGVFQTDDVSKFRKAFRFAPHGGVSFVCQAWVLLAAAAAMRAVYLVQTTAVFGDAVNYADVARAVGTAQPGSADPFWSSLFTFWESLFFSAGLKPVWAAISATFVPGVLLVVPVAWMARALYGTAAAWVAGALCAFHPRLVEYSCNGYGEMFYLFFFAAGTAFLVGWLRSGSAWCGVGWGASFGAFACTRNEALFAFLAVSALSAVGLRRRRDRPGGQGKERWRGWWAAAASFLLVLGGYAALSRNVLGTWGLFQKQTNLAKQFSEQLDPVEAARETYGRPPGWAGTGEGRGTGKGAASKWLETVRRVPRNVLYCLERMPGVLFTPVVLFAMLLPFFASPRSSLPGAKAWPLAVMLLFPPLFYPLVHVEPRLLFPVLVPVQVFGAAGLVAFSAYACRVVRAGGVLVAAAAAIAALSVGLAVWRGADVEKDYAFHRALAAWLETHTVPGQRVAGCGYGYISTTCFLAGRSPVRRLVTDDPGEILRFADSSNTRVLILYEPFLAVFNPGLTKFLDTGMAGFGRAFETADRNGLRVQVYERLPSIEKM